LSKPGDVPKYRRPELGERTVGAFLECSEDGFAFGDFQSEDSDLPAVRVLELFGFLVEPGRPEAAREVEYLPIRDADTRKEHAPDPDRTCVRIQRWST
jgi:hypothetical protein